MTKHELHLAIGPPTCAWCGATDVPLSEIPDSGMRLACAKCIKAGDVKTGDGTPVVLETAA